MSETQHTALLRRIETYKTTYRFDVCGKCDRCGKVAVTRFAAPDADALLCEPCVDVCLSPPMVN